MTRDVIVVYGSGASFDSGYIHKRHSIAPPMDYNFFNVLPEEVRKSYHAINHLYGKSREFAWHTGDGQASLEFLWSLADVSQKLCEAENLRYPDMLKLEEFVEKAVGYVSVNSLRQKFEDANYSYLTQIFDKQIRHPKINVTSKRENLLASEAKRELMLLLTDMYHSGEYELASGREDSYLKLLNQIGTRVIGIVNFNYDLFARNALKRLQGIAEEIDIVHFHGSLAWGEKENCEFEVYDEEVSANYCLGADRYIQPAIVPPVVLKLFPEDRLDYTQAESFYRYPRSPLYEARFRKESTMHSEREKVRDWAREAKTVLIIGYSLPTVDQSSIGFFRQIFENNMLRLVICTASDAQTKDVLIDQYNRKLLLKDNPTVDINGFSNFDYSCLE